MKAKKQKIKKIAKEIGKKILIISLPILIFSGFLLGSLYRYEIKRSTSNLIGSLSGKTDVFEDTVHYLFEETFRDIYIIKNSNEFQNYVKSQNIPNKLEVQHLFERYMLNKEDYLQVRFIDLKGDEVIRVERERDRGIPGPTVDEELQSKKNRYYFENTMSIGASDIYVSNLDLNIEFKKIEEPHLPVIRFSSPVENNKGEIIGILIINFTGQKFLDTFENYLKINNPLIEISLTDGNGYYLFNRDKSKNFGFMFDGDTKEYRLEKEFPELWKMINSSSEEHFETKERVFYFKKIDPVFKKNIYFDNKKFYWNVVASLEKENLPELYPDIFIFKKNIKIYILLGIFALSATITALLQLKKKESIQLYLAELILGYVDEAVLITDSKGNILDFNDEFLNFTDIPKEEILSSDTSLFELNVTHPEIYKDIRKKITKGKKWTGELWLKKQDNSKYPAILTINNVINPKNKNTEYYVCVIKDLTSEKQREAEIEYLLTHHSKTRLPNENLIRQLIDEEIKNNSGFSLIYIKLKNYNDLEIKYNDEFLSLIYENIIEKIEFIVNEKENIAHLSTDTFIAICKTSTNKLLLNKSMIELFKGLKSSINIKGVNVHLEFEMGSVIFPEHGDSSRELLKKALFSIKALKFYPERSYIIYHKSIEKSVRRELDIEENLVSALENNEFQVYFQPQIDSSTETINGLEALIRWNSPILGNVSPLEFIPIAEEKGMINKIDMWVVGEVARLTKMLKLDEYKEIKISVNLSAYDFKNDFLVEDVVAILDFHGLDHAQFEVELTEGTLISDHEYVSTKLEEFKMYGITVAIDDFGTGFSSMSYLKKLNFDKLKIDRSFIKDYPKTDNGSIAEVISYLAQKLNVNLIAEGVETVEQLKYLQSIGCMNIQGYYYSKPLSHTDLDIYLKEHLGKKRLSENISEEY